MLTLKLSVNILWASLNSGVEKDRRGSSFLRMSSNCKVRRDNHREECHTRGGLMQQ